MVNSLLKDPLTITATDESDGDEHDVVYMVKDSEARWGTHDSRANEIEAPMFAVTTPSAVVESQLLRYDRDTHLMPSVFTFVNQVCDAFN